MPLKIEAKSSEEDKHLADVNTLVFAKNKLYSGADDGKIKVWDMNLNKQFEIQGHEVTVYCMTSSEDTLFSCSNDGLIKSWNLEDLKEKGNIHQGDTEVYRIDFNDGILYSSDETGEVRLHSGNVLKSQYSLLEPHKELIFHNGLLYTCRDLDLVITEFKSEKSFQIIMSLMGRAPLCVFNNLLCFSSRGGKDVCVHKNGGEFETVAMVKDAHEMIINALRGTIVNGENILFSAGWDKTVKKWKIDDKSCSLVESCNVDAVVNNLILGENNVLFAGCENGNIIKLSY